MTPEMKLATARLKASKEMPYFAGALVSMTPIFVKEGTLNTFGVTDKGTLIVDSTAVERWDTTIIAGVLVHELLHIIYKHAERAKRIGADRMLWNIAADLAINSDISKTRLKLPEDAVFPALFDLEDGLTAERYYQELIKQAQVCPVCGGTGKPNDEQDQDQDKKQGQSQQSKNKQQDSKQQGCPRCSNKTNGEGKFNGWCGSGAGRPLPSESDIASEIKKTDRSETEINSIRRQAAEELKEAMEKSQGSIPAGLSRWVDEMLKPPKVDWRSKLAMVTRTALAFKPGAVDFTYSRISRRQGALGFGKGHPIIPALHRPCPNIAVAVDTSGSMSQKDLAIALSELDGILQSTGADVTVMSCDAEVGSIKQVKNVKEAANALVGGGGTSFVPIFEEIETWSNKPNVLVIATDGCGPAPLFPVKGVNTIWLLIGHYRQKPSFVAGEFGEFIEVDDDDEDQR